MGLAVLFPGPEQLGRRNVDPFEAAVDPVEVRSDEVSDLRAELIDEEGAFGLGQRGDDTFDVASAMDSPTPGGSVEKGSPERT